MKITDKSFLESSKEFVAKVLSTNTNKEITPEDIYMARFSKTSQNAKGLFSTIKIKYSKSR